jgi:hypothetical protein
VFRVLKGLGFLQERLAVARCPGGILERSTR